MKHIPQLYTVECEHAYSLLRLYLVTTAKPQSQAAPPQLGGCLVLEQINSGTPLNRPPSTANTHDITDNSESSDCPSIHFNT